MTNYDITPNGSATPLVRLYDDSLDVIDRDQLQATEKHAVIEGGTPDSDTDGLEPGEIRFRGYWFGSDAETLAVDRLQNGIIDDSSVTQVDVQAVDDAGSNVTSPRNGIYRLTDQLSVRQVSPATPNAWEYDLRLIEV